ncbi:hypothetical protein Tco_0053673 [Tanacetum coccineum]
MPRGVPRHGGWLSGGLPRGYPNDWYWVVCRLYDRVSDEEMILGSNMALGLVDRPEMTNLRSPNILAINLTDAMLHWRGGSENEFVYDPNPYPYDETPDFSYPPPQPQFETYSCELCGNDSHYGFDCPPRFPLQAANIDQSPPRKKSLQEMEDLKKHYLDEMLSLSNDLQIKDYRNEKIDIRLRRECEDMIDELKGKFNGMSIEINKKKELQYLEQVANLSTYPSQCFKSFCYDDDDYEESTIPLKEIDSQTPPSIEITPVLPTLEPEESLIMGDEELNTILEKELDEFKKSSVEDLVPIPSKSEDTSGSDSDCDLPSCDDFSPINVYEDNVKIYTNPLFEFDDGYIFSDVNPLFNEVLEDIECKDSYDSNFDESTFLVTPLSDPNKDELFTPGDDIEFLRHHDPSTPTISVVSILEGFTDEPPFEENDNLFDLESKTND